MKMYYNNYMFQFIFFPHLYGNFKNYAYHINKFYKVKDEIVLCVSYNKNV